MMVTAGTAAVLAVAPPVPATPAGAAPEVDVRQMPLHVHGGAWPTSHVQGVAIDTEDGYMYWSFTQSLVKTDLEGNVVGTVEGLTGHLGDLDLGKDGRVYGSLEYKAEEAFYIAVFDVDEIDRVGMDAESDGVMTTVHLAEVVADFTADLDGNGVFDGDTASTADHRYGSSGIDGVAFGPEFGKKRGRQLLTVAYGVYSNTTREDNDHQVLLQYDVSKWKKYEQPLSQDDPHRSGPESHAGKYFVHTGNTRYGVQNLEYDAHTGDWLMAVYPGAKEEFPNYSFFIVDGSQAPTYGTIRGQRTPETGELLPLLREGLHDASSGTFGWEFHGDQGIVSLDNGYYYVAEGKQVEVDGVVEQEADVYLYRWTGDTPTPFERVVPAGRLSSPSR
jgi:hypothetical protein